jgi:hypothetical protein
VQVAAMRRRSASRISRSTSSARLRSLMSTRTFTAPTSAPDSSWMGLA